MVVEKMSFLCRELDFTRGREKKIYDFEVSQSGGKKFSSERVGSAQTANDFAHAQAFQRDISGDNYARDCRVSSHYNTARSKSTWVTS